MKDSINLTEKMKTSREVFSGTLLHVYSDEIILPDGKESIREYIRHVGAVAVIPVTEDGNVIMERQYRYPVGDVILEIPAGKLNSKEEDRLQAAKRELLEETGITAQDWKELGVYYPAPAYCDEKITLFLARGLQAGKQNLDEDEFLEIVEIPLKELMELVLAGKIPDGKTQYAVLRAAIELGITEEK